MLDDLKMIHERDVSDALGIVEKQGDQLLQKFVIESPTQFSDIDNIVYAAMGGSGLAALLAHTWPKVNKPFELVRDYELPAYVNNRTLVIASSYSGNTEETLAALADAESKGAQIAVIAGGGKLEEAARARGHAFVLLPKAAQPRYAALYNYRALIDLLELAGFVHHNEATAELEKTAAFLHKTTAAWRADVPTAQNPAKQLAQELMGKSVVIYSGPKLFPAAYRWKIDVNENAKQVAWVNQLPEFNHNEFIGWSQQPVDKPYAVVELRSPLEHPRVQKRFEVTARLLSGLRPEPHVVEAQGDTMLEQMLWAQAFGDFVTIYLALLNGINPAPVDLVEKFKKELG